MHKINNVKVLKQYQLDLKFDDGSCGIVDLSNLAGHGIFSRWEDYAEFQKVKIGDTGELIWGDKIDLCPDSLYLEVTGKKPEDIFPKLKRKLVHA
jgi:hypothetical protein